MQSNASTMQDSTQAGEGEDFDEFIAIRRDIHAHPELAFQERRTSDLVAQRLHAWGYEVTRGLGGTGLVGTLKRGSGTRRLGIRADMDALPVLEQGNHPWKSSYHGLMHACGHDGHTAILLAAAKHVARDAIFEGTLRLIFQPAEEGAGGALRMMEDGLFERFPCDAIYGLHNLPGIPAGHFVFRSGPAMASSDDVTITLKGRGGHGAMPHKTADPIVAAASLVLSLQTVVARNVDPLQTAVVSVGALHAGTANNIIPDQAVLELSVRALDPAVRKQLRERIHAIAQMQAASFEVEASVDWRDGYAVLVNAPGETAIAAELATELFGAEHVTTNGAPITASEDFAFMLEKVPGCYFFVGNGGAGTPGACSVHNPGYDFNDAILAPAARFWTQLVQRYLKAGA